MELKRKISIVLALVLLIGIVLAWTPTSDIDGRGVYSIYNFTYINATELYDDGHRVLTNESALNVNHSVTSNSTTWWADLEDVDETELEKDNGTLGILDSFIDSLIDNRVTKAFVKALGFYDDTEVFNQTEIIDFGYYNLSDFDIADYYLASNPASYYNSSDFDINDYYLTSNPSGFYNLTDFDIADYYLASNPSSFYNISDFDIADYLTALETFNLGYYNSSDFDINDYLTDSEIFNFGYYNSSDFDIDDYYLASNPSNYYNLTDFDIGDYLTALEIFNLGYYNSSDFDINDYLTSLEIFNLGYYNISDFDINDYILKSSESDLNVNSSVYTTYWDGKSSQSEITGTGNLTSLNVTGNVTAPWFNGNILWDYIQNKFIESVGKYFFMDGTTLQMNTTELNDTIDLRAGEAANVTAGDGIKKVGSELSVEAGNGLRQESSGLAVEDAGINNTLLRWKTGQNLTTTDDPTFNDLNIDGTLQPSDNVTFGKGWIIPQGEYGCFDASCNHYIYENSTGALIIV